MSTSAFPWRSIIPISLTVMTAFGIMLYGFSVFLTDGAAGGVFSTGVLSIAFGGGILVGGLLAYPIGRQADHHGVRAIFGLGTVLGAGGLLLFSLASEPWQVIVAWWFLIGPAGAMTFYEPAFVAVDRWCTIEQRPRALAVLTLIGGLAGILFLPGIERLISAVGWRPAARLLGLLLLAVGGGTALIFLRHEPPPANTSQQQQFSLPVILHDKRFRLFTAGMVLSFMSAQAILSHRVALFEETGFAVAGVAIWAAAASAFSLPGRSIAPFLASRFRPTNVQAAVLVVMTVSTLLMIDGSRTWQMATHFTLFGLAFGSVLPLRAMAMSVWFSGESFGRTMGAQWTVASLFGAIGPALVGVLHDWTDGYQAPMAVIVVAMAGAAVLIFLSGRAPSPSTSLSNGSS